MMELNQDVLRYLEDSFDETMELLETLCKIPAPSHHEEKRAAFCKNWLESIGAKGVYIDDALNVIYPVGVGESNPMVVYMAHSDVVFPDTEIVPPEIFKQLCP